MKQPATSIAANNQAAELKKEHKKKILAAMERIEKANYERIAELAGLEKHACMRRLSELEGDQKIYKPGSQSPTSTGRMAFDYRLMEFSDHARKLTQGGLF